MAAFAGWVLVASWCGCANSAADQANTPGFKLSLSAPSIELAQSTAQLISATVTRTGDFAGDVLVRADTVPDKVRVLVQDDEASGRTTSADVAVGADSDAATGTYHITIRASAAGFPDAVQHLDLIVEPAGTKSYSLQVRPVLVAQGDSAVALVNITRANLVDVPITMSMDPVPSGVSYSLYPTTNIKSLSFLTVRVDSAARTGSYNLVLHGAVSGLANRVAVIPLTVVPAGSNTP